MFEAKKSVCEGSFSTIRRPIVVLMGQEAAEKWTAGRLLQPERFLPSRLLGA
jgi:hypothetical protein